MICCSNLHWCEMPFGRYVNFRNMSLGGATAGAKLVQNIEISYHLAEDVHSCTVWCEYMELWHSMFKIVVAGRRSCSPLMYTKIVLTILENMEISRNLFILEYLGKTQGIWNILRGILVNQMLFSWRNPKHTTSRHVSLRSYSCTYVTILLKIYSEILQERYQSNC